jgi:type II secretory pathway pseudopilin PulG
MFLESLDAVVALGVVPSPEGVEAALGGMLFTVGCNDFVKLDQLVDAVLDRTGSPPRTRHAELDGYEVWRVPVGKGKAKAAIYYVRHRDRLLIAFSADTLAAAVTRFGSGPSLPESGDFLRVRNHLPAQVTGLGYVNLPGIATRVRETGLVQMAASASPDTLRLLNLFTAPEMVPFGMGWATSLEDGGVKRTTYGPNTFLGQLPIGGAGIGLPAVAAIAIPNFLAAQDRGQQKRSVADIRNIGTAVESFAVDEGRYPRQGRLASVAEIASRLEPTYIRELPRRDAWGGPYWYWSDGREYLVVSGGRDLMPEADLQGLRALEPGPTGGGDEDIVYSKGTFVRWPEGVRD